MSTISTQLERNSDDAWGRRWDPICKRLIDVTLATIGLVLASPIFVFIAIAIKIETPGPVFYRGNRTGRFGRTFRIYKFRSMVNDAESKGGTTTGKNDARVTAFGCFLRKLKLDELPQLINVIIGDMSLVGPRPEVKEYTDLFTAEERQILTVRPGITDFSSLHFHDLQSHVGDADPDKVFREQILPQKNRLRLKYVRERSLLGDLSILVRTVLVLLTRSFKKD